MICPDCKGAKTTVADHVSYADGRHGYGVTMRCSFCKGLGSLSALQLQWREQGRAMRDDRVNVRRVGLREDAKRRGISPSELSAMEQGRIEPKPA